MEKYDVYDKLNAKNQNFKNREKGSNGYYNRNTMDRMNPNRGNRFKNTACFNCNKLGHIATNCWHRVNPQSSNFRKQYTYGSNPNNWQRNTNRNPNIICYNCNKRGHLARQCWAKNNFFGAR